MAIPANSQRPSARPSGTNAPHGESEGKRDFGQREAALTENELPIGDAKEDPATQGEQQAQLEEWRGRALRLQADMENFRKRQQRAAQDQIRQERSRLLNAFLEIVDDLERALATPVGNGDSGRGDGIRRGVELTHRAAVQLLEREGAVVMNAKGQPFDPNWHEAVATVPRNGRGVAPGTVIEVVGQGYRIEGQLLRPAKVVVAV